MVERVGQRSEIVRLMGGERKYEEQMDEEEVEKEKDEGEETKK